MARVLPFQIKRPDLADLSHDHLGQALRRYAANFREFGFGHLDYDQLLPTPNKGYTARTDVPITLRGHMAGTMNVIMFAPGDGTGSNQTYNPAQFVHSICHEETTPDRLCPRSKKDILVEAFFPLFTLYDGKVHPGLASLEVLTVSDSPRNKPTALFLDSILGEKHDAYEAALSLEPVDSTPNFLQPTTGCRLTGERFGDPHAVYCRKSRDPLIAHAQPLQVVGFFALRAINLTAAGFLETVVKVPPYYRA